MNTYTAYGSGIRRYMAFCHQFSLHPLPLTDINLYRLVPVLHDQWLSPSSIHLYLSSLHFLQISSNGQEPCLMFHFSAAHIPDTSNTTADAVSCNNVTAFSLLVPQVPQVEVPPVLLDLLVLEMPEQISLNLTNLFAHPLQRESL